MWYSLCDRALNERKLPGMLIDTNLTEQKDPYAVIGEKGMVGPGLHEK